MVVRTGLTVFLNLSNFVNTLQLRFFCKFGGKNLPRLKLPEGDFYDDVFEDDADEDVAGDDGEKGPPEVLESGRRKKQLENSLKGTKRESRKCLN